MGDNDISNLLAEYPELSQDALKAADEELDIVIFINGREEDGVTPFWAFIAIKPSKYIDFRKSQMEGESFLIEDYGYVIVTGKGKEPSEDVVKEMRDGYGFDPDFEQKAMEVFKQFQAVKADERKKKLLEKIKRRKDEDKSE